MKGKSMKSKKLFLVVPKIIEQPTWGGDFILELKKWQKKEPFQGLKIGQSYELYSGSYLRADLKSSADPDFLGELGSASNPDETIYRGKRSQLISLSNLISSDPLGTLGKVAAKRHKNKLNLLIKLTQAKDNSFQLHIGRKTKSKKWQPKPESWYFLKPGLVTLGLKPGTDPDEYRLIATALNFELNELSKRIQEGGLGLAEAKRLAEQLLKKLRPWKFVNKLKIGENKVVDLSEGGLHHSWEDDSSLPLGNVVYELQQDVMDPVSTLRSFDKGKFKSDGTLRPLNIVDYFKYLNTSPEYNRPERHILKPKNIYSRPGIKITQIMSNPDYSLEKLTLQAEYSGEHTNTDQSFHHLFIQCGSVQIITDSESLELSAGHSCFIPSWTENYKLRSLQAKTEILKSFIA